MLRTEAIVLRKVLQRDAIIIVGGSNCAMLTRNSWTEARPQHEARLSFAGQCDHKRLVVYKDG